MLPVFSKPWLLLLLLLLLVPAIVWQWRPVQEAEDKKLTFMRCCAYNRNYATDLSGFPQLEHCTPKRVPVRA